MILKRIFTIIKYRLWLFRGWILKNKKKFVMGTMACALVIGIVGWIFFRTYHNYEVVNEIKRKSDTSANYYFDEDGMLLCDPIDGSPPGFPVPGILQARTPDWVAISFSNA